MLKKLGSIIVSTRTMTALLFLFALAMAIGTFVENSYNTPTAKKWIYNAWWFEAIMLLLVINFIGNIKRYNLLRWKKWATLTLHLSWILIIIGAGITRYYSFEGMMLIREGETADSFLSDQTYFEVYKSGFRPSDSVEVGKIELDDVILTEYDYDYKYKDDFFGKEFSIEIDTLYMNAVESLIPSEDGDRYLKLVEAGNGTRHDHFLLDGKQTSIHGVLVGLNLDRQMAIEQGAINILNTKEGYKLQTPHEGAYLRMADQKEGEVFADSIQPLNLRSLYTIGNFQFVIPEPVIQGRMGIIQSAVKTPENAAGIFATVRSGDEQRQIELLGGKGITSRPEEVDINGLHLKIRYGSIEHKTPFSITLQDFIAEKYPGTEQAYSAFVSEVLVNTPTDTIAERIYMNNVLDKDGYRFFQAGFDPDELGTHLSVNYDELGKNVTYAGYILLYIALMAILFDRNSRFGELRRLINRVKKRKNKLGTSMALLLFFGASQMNAQQNRDHDHSQIQPSDTTENIHQTNNERGRSINRGTPTESVSTNLDEADLQQQQQQAQVTTTEGLFVSEVFNVDSLIVANAVPVEVAEKFGTLVVQDNGRMKPMSTLASEVLRRIHEKDYYEAKVSPDSTVRLTSEQVILSMIQVPQVWWEVELIKLKRGNDSLRKVLGVPLTRKYARGVEFFSNDDEVTFKLSPFLEEANAADVKNQFQKDFLDINYSLGLLDQVVSGSLLKIYPLPVAENNKWFSRPEVPNAGFIPEDSTFAMNSMMVYRELLRRGNITGEYERAGQVVDAIKEFQRQRSNPEVMPSDDKIEIELLYNKYDVFKNLYMWYAWFGIFMLILLIAEIIRPMRELRWAITYHKWVIAALLLVHTAGLAMRWYISGHAPWSDAYESMIYVGWATMAFGLAFGRKSDLTIAATAFVTAIILWVAHLNWLEPDISNLQPVLDSYWLMIHVAVIVASYGPFALSAILGIVVMILYILSNKKNKSRMDLNIKELTYINEVSLTVGLIMLTIGNFLGGMWANESWGRYWGWDPKETWALITIFVYAIVIHMRIVPGLKGKWLFNLMSILAFASVLMTYFGVNFYLSGLHSYASGDQIISYKFIGFTLGVVALIAILAKRRGGKIFRKV